MLGTAREKSIVHLAPAGRHVCRIGWMHDKLVVEYGNSTYRLPSNLGKIIAYFPYRTDKKALNTHGND